MTTVITGATSDGIGRRVAHGLLEQGHHLISLARPQKVDEHRDSLQGAFPDASIEVWGCDCARVDDLREVGARLGELEYIDRLVHSLGVMHRYRTETVDGIEGNVMVNAIAPWLLTVAAWQPLIRSGDGRVASVSSWGYRAGPGAKPDDLHQQNLTYEILGAYFTSKDLQLNLLQSLHDMTRLTQVPIKINHIDPGLVRTELGRDLDRGISGGWLGGVEKAQSWVHHRLFAKPADAAAAPIVDLVTSPYFAPYAGTFFSAPGPLARLGATFHGQNLPPSVPTKMRYEANHAAQLVAACEELVGFDVGPDLTGS